MVLYQHDNDYIIRVNGEDLMHSRQHASEQALARLGCAHLAGRPSPRVLVGGLGMGFTLRQALDLLPPGAAVVVGELMDAVVTWNREHFGRLNDHPLSDPRVDLRTGDAAALIASAKDTYDAILLDIDNGPAAVSAAANQRLYGHQGITACRRALRRNGCLAVWSSVPGKRFEHVLMDCDFHVRRYRVPAHPGKNAPSCFVWVAARNARLLPEGGGAPRPAAPPAGRPRNHRRGR